MSEEIVYSGKRWAVQGVPDGTDAVQDCGTQSGSRAINGNIVAVNETVVRRMHALPFPSGIGGGSAPATRYENAPRVSVGWEEIPLSELTRPRAGGGGAYGSGSATVKFCKLSFSFSEILVNLPAGLKIRVTLTHYPIHFARFPGGLRGFVRAATQIHTIPHPFKSIFSGVRCPTNRELFTERFVRGFVFHVVSFLVSARSGVELTNSTKTS